MKKKEINLKDFKMIVSDIDGTLMGKDHKIHQLTRDIVFHLRDKGFHFTLATGKNLPSTISQADALKIDLPLILINGAMLQKRNGDILCQTTLPIGVTNKVIEICDEQGKDLVIYIGDEIILKKMNKNLDEIYGHVETGLIEVGEWHNIKDKIMNTNKCLVVDTNDRENLFKIGHEFSKIFDEKADIVHASQSLVEVMPKGVTKVTGIRILADSLGIPMNKIIAFGDFDNDVEMLSTVGLGIAVENASPKAKSAAQLVIGSVDEQGPAMFLEKLLDR